MLREHEMFLANHQNSRDEPKKDRDRAEPVSKSLHSIIAIQGIAQIMDQRCHVIQEQQNNHTIAIQTIAVHHNITNLMS